jgi:hypothetical protein
MRKASFRLVLSAAVLCVLIAAEAMAVRHSLDFEAHTASDPCNICITVAGFGSAAPAHSLSVRLPVSAPLEPVTPLLVMSTSRPVQPPVRGPPLVS